MIAALAALALAAAPAVDEAVDTAKLRYLQAHEIGGGPVVGPLTLRLPEALTQARLVLLGESHGAAAPQVIDLALLTELNRRAGVRDYLAEMDPLQAERLNRYLAGGDEADLARVFALWRGTAQWGNTAFMAKVRGVRALNLRLPLGRRVRFLGVDAIQDWPLLLDWLAARGVVIDRAAFDAAPDDPAKAALAAAALGSQTDPLAARIASTLALMARKAGRERTIFESYAYAVRSGELGLRPAYGLWGLFHVLQGRINGVEPFAARVVASDLPTRGAVASVALLALDSAMMMPGAKPQRMTQFNVDGPLVRAPGALTLRAASRPDRITLWRLDAPGSPYAGGGPDLVAVQTKIGQSFKPDDPALPTARYAQYAGVYRGSDWAPPSP